VPGSSLNASALRRMSAWAPRCHSWVKWALVTERAVASGARVDGERLSAMAILRCPMPAALWGECGADHLGGIGPGAAVAPLAGAHGWFRIWGNAPAGAARRSPPAPGGCGRAGCGHIPTAARCPRIRGRGIPAGPRTGACSATSAVWTTIIEHSGAHEPPAWSITSWPRKGPTGVALRSSGIGSAPAGPSLLPMYSLDKRQFPFLETITGSPPYSIPPYCPASVSLRTWVRQVAGETF